MARTIGTFNLRSKLLLSNLVTEIIKRAKDGSFSKSEIVELVWLLHYKIPHRIVDLADLVRPYEKSLPLVDQIVLRVSAIF